MWFWIQAARGVFGSKPVTALVLTRYITVFSAEHARHFSCLSWTPKVFKKVNGGEIMCFWKYLAGKKNTSELQCLSYGYKSYPNPVLGPSDLGGIQGQKGRSCLLNCGARSNDLP